MKSQQEGKDDDGNGFVDDVYGWDFYNNDNNPHDDNSHGTHCAGTIGGVGNNGKGVVGVCWETSMVGIKFLGGSGGGFLRRVKSIAYATKIGVQLTPTPGVEEDTFMKKPSTKPPNRVSVLVQLPEIIQETMTNIPATSLPTNRKTPFRGSQQP